MQKIIKAFLANLTPKEKTMLYVAVGILSLAVFDRLVIGPIVRQSKTIEENIQSKVSNIKKDLTILEHKDKIVSEDKGYGAFYAKKGATQEELIASFLGEVEELAKDAGIALVNINPVVTEEKKGYTQASLVIECTGSMKSVLDFIYGIDNSKKPLRVYAYDISPKSKENYEAKCTITIIKMIIIPGQKPKNPEKKK